MRCVRLWAGGGGSGERKEGRGAEPGPAEEAGGGGAVVGSCPCLCLCLFLCPCPVGGAGPPGLAGREAAEADRAGGGRPGDGRGSGSRWAPPEGRGLGRDVSEGAAEGGLERTTARDAQGPCALPKGLPALRSSSPHPSSRASASAGSIIRPQCREVKKDKKSLIPHKGMLGPSQPPLKELK